MTGLETAIAGAAIKEGVAPAKGLIARVGKPMYERLIVEYCNCFQSHVQSSFDRCKFIKNVLYRDNSVELYSQYVNINFKHRESLISDQELAKAVIGGGAHLVSGTAGAGKTMFMKWLTLHLIDNLPNHQRIPLFLELRYVNEQNLAGGMLKFILDATSAARDRVSIERFKIGLELGQFILVLDAVDEVKPELRQQVLSEIRTLLADYPQCSLLLSSRPDDELEALQDLTVYRSEAMTKEQIVEVIRKLEFDGVVKDRLIDRLESGLFEEHETFLSNPLLATIMLLNFDHSADIPTKLTSFYRQAFEALYQRHDAAKGVYRRGHHAGLPLDEYEKVFSAFCFDSFMDSKVQFTDTELLEYFSEAATYYEITAKPRDLVEDARRSVCVIQREGLDNVFVHRTFQEYFTALFLSRYREEDFVEQIENSVLGWRNQNVLKMLLEMSPEAVEAEWLAPKVKAVVDVVRRARLNTVGGCRKVFNVFYSSITVSVDRGLVVGFSSQNFPKSDLNAGGWMSTVGLSYNPPRPLTRAIFKEKALFEDLFAYAHTQELAPSDEDLIEKIGTKDLGNDNEEEVIDLSSSDIPWLMESQLPDLLKIVRSAIIEFEAELNARIANRAEALSRLRTRRSSLTRRKRA